MIEGSGVWSCDGCSRVDDAQVRGENEWFIKECGSGRSFKIGTVPVCRESRSVIGPRSIYVRACGGAGVLASACVLSGQIEKQKL